MDSRSLEAITILIFDNSVSANGFPSTGVGLLAATAGLGVEATGVADTGVAVEIVSATDWAPPWLM